MISKLLLDFDLPNCRVGFERKVCVSKDTNYTVTISALAFYACLTGEVWLPNEYNENHYSNIIFKFPWVSEKLVSNLLRIKYNFNDELIGLLISFVMDGPLDMIPHSSWKLYKSPESNSLLNAELSNWVHFFYF